jgi:hypothetical protein
LDIGVDIVNKQNDGAKCVLAKPAKKHKMAKAKKDAESNDNDPAACFVPMLDDSDSNANNGAHMNVSFPGLRETSSVGKRRKLNHCVLGQEPLSWCPQC